MKEHVIRYSPFVVLWHTQQNETSCFSKMHGPARCDDRCQLPDVVRGKLGRMPMLWIRE